MLIILQKIVGTNRIHYPDATGLFDKGFINPDNPQELVVENNSGKTLTELSANVPYTVVEYFGEDPNREIKLVGMGALGELLPDEVLVELTDYQNDTQALQAIRNGATRILTRINSNQPVDVLDPAFIALLQSLVAFTSLTLPQATSIFQALKNG